jgi:hypothetical protein
MPEYPADLFYSTPARAYYLGAEVDIIEYSTASDGRKMVKIAYKSGVTLTVPMSDVELH